MKVWKKWTREEEKILKEDYGSIPISEICEKLPNRTKSQISGKAFHMGLSQAYKRPVSKVFDPFDRWNISRIVVEYFQKDGHE